MQNDRKKTELLIAFQNFEKNLQKKMDTPTYATTRNPAINQAREQVVRKLYEIKAEINKGTITNMDKVRESIQEPWNKLVGKLKDISSKRNILNRIGDKVLGKSIEPIKPRKP